MSRMASSLLGALVLAACATSVSRAGTDPVVSSQVVADLPGFTPPFHSVEKLVCGDGWIWSNDSRGVIRRHDPRTFEVVQEIELPVLDRPQGGIAWYQGHLWSARNGRILEIDAATGTLVRSFFAVPMGDAVDMCWHQGELWVLTTSPPTLQRIDTETGAQEKIVTFNPFASYSGLDSDGESLLITSVETDLIYRMEPGTGFIQSYFPAPGSLPTGICWDGYFVWVADPYGQGDPEPGPRVYRIDLHARNYDMLVRKDLLTTPLRAGKGVHWWDGYLWHTNSWEDTLYRMEPSFPLEILDRFPLPYYGPTGLTHRGTSLWNTDGQSSGLYELDPATGAILRRHQLPFITPLDLDFDGTRFWIVGDASEDVHLVDPETGEVVDRFPAPGPHPGGVAWDGSSMWIADWGTNLLDELDPGSRAVEHRFLIPNGVPLGTTYDSDHGWFWVVDDTQDRIFAYSLPPGGGNLIHYEITDTSDTVTLNLEVSEDLATAEFLVERKVMADGDYETLGTVMPVSNRIQVSDAEAPAFAVSYYRFTITGAVPEAVLGPFAVDRGYVTNEPTSVREPPPPPPTYRFQVKSPHPNPFAARTTVEYVLDAPRAVDAVVLDISGRVVARLADNLRQPEGEHRLVWSGADGTGRRVSAGVYFLAVSVAGRGTTTRKVVLLGH